MSFAFWPGGMKNACFLASFIISSVITFRLNRRKALSIDSPGLIFTTAIYFSSLVSQLFPVARFRTHIKHAPQSQGQARMENPANSSRYPRGLSVADANNLGRDDLKILLSTQALDLDGLVAVIRLNLLLLEYHFLIKLTHHDFLFVRSLRSFHLWFVRPG